MVFLEYVHYHYKPDTQKLNLVIQHENMNFVLHLFCTFIAICLDPTGDERVDLEEIGFQIISRFSRPNLVEIPGYFFTAFHKMSTQINHQGYLGL